MKSKIETFKDLGLASSPAMNAASPTAYDECVASGLSCEYDPHGRKGESQCRYCGRAAPVGQGSATSGEAAAHFKAWAATDDGNCSRIDLREYSVDSYERRTDGATFISPLVERDWTVWQAASRAALAAKAEQSNTAGAAKGGNTCDLTNYDSACNYSNGTATVVLRAAAPASVPEGYVLALQTVVEMPDGTKDLGYTLLDGVGIFQTRAEVSAAIAELSLPIGWVSMTTDQLLPGWTLPAAPEVAQPAAQGEMPEFRTLVVKPSDAPYTLAYYTDPDMREWGASQRQEGRRDMHETNIALVNENCALVEKLAAWGAKRAPGSAAQQEVWEFVAMLSLQSGGELNGNRLSARAKELLAKMESSAPTAALSKQEIARLIEQHTGMTKRQDERAYADLVRLVEAVLDAAPTAGEPSACPTCPKETPYGPAICGKCVEAGESSAMERDAARYRHIRDTRFNGYDLRGPANIGNWHVSRKMLPGEGAYYFGEHLDAAVDEDIVAAHIKATQGGKEP